MMNMTLDDYSEWYKLVDNPKDLNDPEWCIELINGEWKGMLYKYTRYNFDVESKKVKFGYDVLYVPDNILGVKYPDGYQEKFDRLLGDVLVDIVSKDVEKNLMEEDDAKLGNTYSEDSDVRRVIYKESNPFLKN
jgi:hypothetical protein